MDLRIVLVASAALLLSVGCNKEEKASGGAVGASTGAATAAAGGDDPAAYFKMKCAVCHGDTGGGDGPGGTALDPKPRNFTDATWQGATKDEEIKKAIVEGGASIGKSATMPGNPDLRSNPALSDALVKYVRGLKK